MPTAARTSPVELRRGDHSERLRIERERLELERELGEKLEAMLQDPATKDRLCGTSGGQVHREAFGA